MHRIGARKPGKGPGWCALSASGDSGDRRGIARLLATGTARPEDPMINTTTLDELAKRIGRAIEASPAKDVEKNVKALLQGALAKLDVVPRAEFDVQAKVLARTREKLEALERQVAALEARAAPPR